MLCDDGSIHCSTSEPSEKLKLSFALTISETDWKESQEEEIVLDIGCGSGTLTKALVLPIFSRPKIYAIDKLEEIIQLAERENPHRLIEYYVADIEDFSTVAALEGEVTKAVSVMGIHWLKNQQTVLENIFKLLKQGGEAIILVTKDSTFYDTVLEIQNDPKWIQYFQNIDNSAVDSPFEGHTAGYYDSMLMHIGFQILYLKEDSQIDTFPSMRAYKAVFSSICFLVPYIPDDRKEEFKNDFIKALLDKNGLDEDGLPFHIARMYHYILRKI